MIVGILIGRGMVSAGEVRQAKREREKTLKALMAPVGVTWMLLFLITWLALLRRQSGLALLALTARYHGERLLREPVLSSSSAVRGYLRCRLAGARRELFAVLFL